MVTVAPLCSILAVLVRGLSAAAAAQGFDDAKYFLLVNDAVFAHPAQPCDSDERFRFTAAPPNTLVSSAAAPGAAQSPASVAVATVF